MAQPPRPALFAKNGPLPPFTFELGEDWYANIFLDDFVSIRKYIHYISPKLYPTSEGVLLNREQWKALVSNARRVSSSLKKKQEETIVECPPMTICTTREQKVVFKMVDRKDLTIEKTQWENLALKMCVFTGFFSKRKAMQEDAPAKQAKMETLPENDEVTVVEEWCPDSQVF